MPVDVEETRLPGIGSKFTLRLDAGGRLAVILHNDGKRELYYFRHAADEEPRAVITLDDDDARQLGAVVGRAKTGITVIAILREPEPVTGAQPADTIERGDTLVTVGKAGQYPEFRRLLRHGGAAGSALHP